jgi:geranylgeranyl diphosphate synthase type I
MEARVRKVFEKTQALLEQKGAKSLENAQRRMRAINVESREVREALDYFASYWHDLARPALLSLACEAVGGLPTPDFGTATVLIGGAISIYDDIIDRSKMKKSRPTVLGKFGNDIALLTATALVFESFTYLNELLKKLEPHKMTIILQLFRNLFYELGDAEALELNFRGRVDVAPREYLHMVRKKAGDVEAQMRIGALLGNASEQEIEALAQYGRSLGMMMILRDDLADLLDEKELLHRVKRESLPLPILYASSNPKAREEAASIVGKKKMGKRDAQRLIEIANETKGLTLFGDAVRSLTKESIRSLMPIKHRKNLRLLVDSVTPMINR